MQEKEKKKEIKEMAIMKDKARKIKRQKEDMKKKERKKKKTQPKYNKLMDESLNP